MAQSTKEAPNSNASKPRNILNAKVSDQDITDIIRQLRPEECQILYYELNLTTVDIENAESGAVPSTPVLKARRVFEVWRTRNGHRATRDSLLRGLAECRYIDAKEELEKTWNLKGEIKGAQHAPELDFTICQQELISYYIMKMGSVQLLPWCDEDTDGTAREMEDIYVTLELETKSNSTSSLLERNEDLVTLDIRGEPATRVLVKGVAGSGKSTLLAKLAYTWAQQKRQQDVDSPLSSFDLLFIITLREVHGDCSLFDIISQQILPEDTRTDINDLRVFVKNNPKKVLILLDGFDEYADETGCDNNIDKMIKYKVLRDCRVILSTRPHKHLGKYQQDYVSVNLTGFSTKNVKLYMSRFFRGSTLMVESLAKRFQESETLSFLSTIPVLLMLMCLLWKDVQKLEDTQSGLYQQFALCLWRKYATRKGKTNVGSGSDEEFDKTLIELGQKALEGLCSEDNIKGETLLFPQDDFSPLQLELGHQTGLLTKERLRSKLNIVNYVTFLHKSFQEFCAAQYFSNLYVTDQNEFHRILKWIDSWGALMSKMEFLRFCCGVACKSAQIEIVHHALHLFKFDGDRDIKQIYLLSHVCSRFLGPDMLPVLNLLDESHILPNYTPNNKQLIPLTETIQSIFTRGELSVDCKDNSLLAFHNFVKSDFALTSMSKIKKLHLGSYDIKSTDTIIDTLKRTSLVKEVRLSLVDLAIDSGNGHARDDDHNENRLKEVGNILASLCNLRSLAVNAYGCGTSVIVQHLSLSPYCQQYEHLEFDFNNVCFEIAHMTRLLSKAKNLKRLTLLGIVYSLPNFFDAIRPTGCNLENMMMVGDAAMEM